MALGEQETVWPDAGSTLVWVGTVPTEGPVPLADLEVLSSAETCRLAALRFGDDRRAYAAAHVLVRCVLAQVLGGRPRDVPIRSEACRVCGGPHGRPVVESRSGLRFSLSHTTGAVLVGLSAYPVGVDVERIPAPEVVAALLDELHPDERAHLEALPVDERVAGFAQLWVRKEAYLKALGTGLTRALNLDYLGPDPNRRPPGWVVQDLALGSLHRAAVVLREGGPAPVVLRTDKATRNRAIPLTAPTSCDRATYKHLLMPPGTERGSLGSAG